MLYESSGHYTFFSGWAGEWTSSHTLHTLPSTPYGHFFIRFIRFIRIEPADAERRPVEVVGRAPHPGRFPFILTLAAIRRRGMSSMLLRLRSGKLNAFVRDDSAFLSLSYGCRRLFYKMAWIRFFSSIEKNKGMTVKTICIFRDIGYIINDVCAHTHFAPSLK